MSRPDVELEIPDGELEELSSDVIAIDYVDEEGVARTHEFGGGPVIALVLNPNTLIITGAFVVGEDGIVDVDDDDDEGEE